MDKLSLILVLLSLISVTTDQVKRYSSLLTHIVPQILVLALEYQTSRGTDKVPNGTTFNFTEDWAIILAGLNVTQKDVGKFLNVNQYISGRNRVSHFLKSGVPAGRKHTHRRVSHC